jgi:hypothetical protein
MIPELAGLFQWIYPSAIAAGMLLMASIFDFLSSFRHT